MNERIDCATDFHAASGRRRGILATLATVALLVLANDAPTAQAGTLVKYSFQGFGDVFVDLFEDRSPLTVANHLQYINANSYNNTMLHRVDVGLGVIQGGGFKASDASEITTFASIPLEYALPNKRGTIAMARSTAQDSAKAQWFINTDDNSSSLGQTNNGGYAVFGQVVGNGMSVVDALAAVPTYQYGGAFGQLPLTNFSQAQYQADEDPMPHLIVLNGVTIISQNHPDFQNPWLNVDVDNKGSLENLDALLIINDLKLNHNNQPYTPQGPYTGTNYYDVNGDGLVSAIDALRVINALLTAGGGGGGAGPMVGGFTSVPEPGTIALAASGALALGSLALVRRWRRKRS
jgi:peptidyl-prolyl cis-trans isomerase A (cyclophilin A)